MKLTAGVNSTNTLQAAFCTKVFLNLTVLQFVFLISIFILLDKKAACKMFVKMTTGLQVPTKQIRQPGFNFMNHF